METEPIVIRVRRMRLFARDDWKLSLTDTAAVIEDDAQQTRIVLDRRRANEHIHMTFSGQETNVAKIRSEGHSEDLVIPDADFGKLCTWLDESIDDVDESSGQKNDASSRTVASEWRSMSLGVLGVEGLLAVCLALSIFGESSGFVAMRFWIVAIMISVAVGAAARTVGLLMKARSQRRFDAMDFDTLVMAKPRFDGSPDAISRGTIYPIAAEPWFEALMRECFEKERGRLEAKHLVLQAEYLKLLEDLSRYIQNTWQWTNQDETRPSLLSGSGSMTLLSTLKWLRRVAREHNRIVAAIPGSALGRWNEDFLWARLRPSRVGTSNPMRVATLCKPGTLAEEMQRLGQSATTT